MSHCIMLSISLNDPSPINPSYTHRNWSPNNTYHHSLTRNTRPNKNNVFHLPQWAFPHESFIHTFIHPHTKSEYIPSHPLYNNLDPSLPFMYASNNRSTTGTLGLPSWRMRQCPIGAGSGCRGPGGSPKATWHVPMATGNSPDTDTAKTTQQDCSHLPNNIASASGMHSMVPSLRLPAPAHRLLKHRPGGKPSQQCNRSVFSRASRYLRCT